jgi:hypothetical protein
MVWLYRPRRLVAANLHVVLCLMTESPKGAGDWRHPFCYARPIHRECDSTSPPHGLVD